MFDDMKVPVFVLTNLTGKTSCDIIGLTKEGNYNTFLGYLNNNNIGFVVISADDATKLLLNRGGIGMNCFITTPFSVELNERRLAEAAAQFRQLTEIVGIIITENPIELSLKKETPVA